jgi:putative phosphoribosyl transferase
MIDGSQAVRIGPLGLAGEFEPVWQALGVVVFVHGSGSDRTSPRSRHIAGVLRGHHLATLRFDLLSTSEMAPGARGVAIAERADRVGQALDWLHSRPETDQLRVGLLGSGTGAAAALLAAARRPARVAAIVSRCGCPDLVSGCLPRVRAPTLLIVGGEDAEFLEPNRRAMHLLAGEKRLETVPGAGHPLDEPGALAAAADLAAVWLVNRLRGRHSA